MYVGMDLDSHIIAGLSKAKINYLGSDERDTN